ncbi:MAG: transposase [Gammaproteobacteria bacterium RIFCSPLOWO2_12_47_11]|nr:MAG: transposase [Gammaproteobacteria bacterium RIFCSPLOWO2_12_47_11]
METNAKDKLIAWLHGEIKSPPFSLAARLEAGYLLRCLQRGEKPGMPHSRPMPPIGARCHELRIIDRNITWRIIYRTDPDAIVIVEIFEKETNQTPKRIINICKERLSDYDNATS